MLFATTQESIVDLVIKNGGSYGTKGLTIKKLIVTLLMVIGLGSTLVADVIKVTKNKTTKNGLIFGTLLFNHQLYFVYNREKNQKLTSSEVKIEFNIIKSRMCSDAKFVKLIEMYQPILIYSAKNSTIMLQIDDCDK